MTIEVPKGPVRKILAKDRAVTAPKETVATLSVREVKKMAQHRYKKRRQELETFCREEAGQRGIQVIRVKGFTRLGQNKSCWFGRCINNWPT